MLIINSHYIKNIYKKNLRDYNKKSLFIKIKKV